MATNWYAVRVKPGSQRMAKAIVPKEGEEIPDHLIGETILERECRQEGIPVFMPTIWLCVHKHRARKFVRRRVPFFTGYAFVNIHPGEFEKVRREVDSITSFLRHSRFSAPAVFPDELIAQLASDDFARYQEHREETIRLQEMARLQRIRELRSERSRIKHTIVGRGRRKNKVFAADIEQYLEGADPEVKARLLAVERELKTLEEAEMLVEKERQIA